MKKILSYCLVATIALAMASCDGNEPEQATLFFNIQTLSTKARITVMSSDNDVFFFSNYIPKSELEQAGGLQKLAESFFSQRKFDELYTDQAIFKIREEYSLPSLQPNTVYVLYACVVDKDEQGYARVSGRVFSREFTTLPEYTLPGVFSVSDTKKVRFSSGNTYKELGHYRCFSPQSKYVHAAEGNTIDYYHWEKISDITSQLPDFSVLSADEWIYLFTKRPRAERLFAPAMVDGVSGLILLPDYWQTPAGVTLTNANEWSETAYTYMLSNEEFDGYNLNKLTQSQWFILEYAGAVFLPAPERYNGVPNKLGWYWSSSEYTEDPTIYAHAFSFSPYNLALSTLKTSAIAQDGYRAVRLVKEVK